MHFRLGQISEVCLAACGGEEDVVLPPKNDGIWLTPTQKRLPLRIELYVLSIVVEEVELHPLGVRAREEVQIHVPAIRADQFGIGMAMRVNGPHCLCFEEGLERLLRFRRLAFPVIITQAVPDRRESLF